MRQPNFLTLVALTSFVVIGFSDTSLHAAETVTIPARVKLIRSVEIPAREPGLLKELVVKEGDQVQEGDVLAKLDTELYDLTERISRIELEVAVEKARNDVNKRFAEKSREVSSAVVARSQQALNRYSKSISKTEMEKLRLEAERDVLSIEQATNEQGIAGLEKKLADAELEANQLKLEYRTILAPFDGMIVEPITMQGVEYPQQGEWVNTGQPVLRIVDLTSLRLEARVSADIFDASSLGKPVEFIVKDRNGEETKFPGEIVFVSPEINIVSNEIVIRADIRNPEMTLRPGQKGLLKIEL